MKLLLFLTLSVTSLCLSLDYQISNPNQNGQYFLVTYPKSGTNWTTSIIQFMTKRNFLHAFTKKEVEAVQQEPHFEQKAVNNAVWRLVTNVLEVRLDKKLQKVVRCHNPKELFSKTYPLIDKRQNSLIVIIRNYKESIFRKYQSYKGPFDITYEDVERRCNRYIENIEFYEKWKGKKLLIYYEDLLESPEKEMLKLAKFFNVNRRCIRAFMKRYTFYKNKSVASYHKKFKWNTRFPDGSFTKGDDLLFYSKARSRKFLNDFDEYMKQEFPLFDKYLSRYLEK